MFPQIQHFQINCVIWFIDFEEKTDGESIIKLTAQLKPRRMILVRGTEDNLTAAQKDFCSEVIGDENNIFVPKNGDVTTERSIY